MGSEWKISTVGDFCPFIYGKALPERSRTPGMFPVISSAGVSGSHNEPLVNTAGVVIGRKGTVGSVTLSKSAFWPIDTVFYIADEPQRDLLFTYYLLKTLGLDRMNSDSAVPGLNRENAHARIICVPELQEQRAIAHILGTLDDKIELNRQQNKTLEEMAHALFKAWFVDFEPVRAKMEGRWQPGQTIPGLPAHLYDLFPDRLVETEQGEIPESWQMRSLDSVASYLNGLALQKFPPESETEFFPVIKIAQLRAGNTNSADKASTQIKPEYVVNDGDVLFSWSGSLEVEVWNGGRGALNQHLFKVTSSEVPKWFYFFATRHHLPDFRTIAAGKATTMGHIQRKHLTAAKIAVATPEQMEKIDAFIAPQFEQMIRNAQQSRTLAQLRDTLLPKLISGELRVADNANFIENSISLFGESNERGGP
ncbi:restriction endonuclease subunit S [Vandammella animalimorsus]|uniref:Restriction endonuclease n=1 Tax=Vandammella animalimorsus TaxID=2029117 RepID=A0A2A2AC47_9BURK|nr:restriction endonuclease subunit S [Vandammella animalimorsus]PAT35318.1 restriction endonuclease [Vandammella animalimorsus]